MRCTALGYNLICHCVLLYWLFFIASPLSPILLPENKLYDCGGHSISSTKTYAWYIESVLVFIASQLMTIIPVNHTNIHYLLTILEVRNAGAGWLGFPTWPGH